MSLAAPQPDQSGAAAVHQKVFSDWVLAPAAAQNFLYSELSVSLVVIN